MSKVTVFRVSKYDIATNSTIISRRMATREGAQIMGARILEDTATFIDASQLEPGEQWTPINFSPNPRTGFQTQVLT
ncbi:MAG TPA: hypothetical protein VIF39_06770 [Hyphomicrobium sp.]|jgi:hypothetical protein